MLSFLDHSNYYLTLNSCVNCASLVAVYLSRLYYINAQFDFGSTEVILKKIPFGFTADLFLSSVLVILDLDFRVWASCSMIG